MASKTYYDIFLQHFLQEESFQRRALKCCCPRWFFDIPYNHDCTTGGCLKCWDTVVDSVPAIK